MTSLQQMAEPLGRIARQYLGLQTLRCRYSDRLDFHDVSVWALLDMMQSAYDAGFEAGRKARSS
jgi:hypothetical protein